MFIDEQVVRLKAGSGGDGCMSFRREKYIPMGGPDGGDGGHGGSIILECDVNEGDLTTYYYKPNWKAEHGETGKGRKKAGAGGKDRILKMPPGTIVYDKETGRKVAELLYHGQKLTLIKGGKGGLGNVHFKSSTNQAPRKITLGEKLEEQEFRLVLKVIADVGLVGYPNAGKSSLTRALTKAHPKAAPYPFTTKIPNVGIIEYDQEHNYKRVSLADIPGLIDGASQNRGLGHRFLRHIERCRLLAIIVDMGGVDTRDPLKDYENLLKELELYNPKLLEKDRLVIANKMDIEEASDNLKRFKKKYKVEIQPISCVTVEGINKLKETFLEQVAAIAPNV